MHARQGISYSENNFEEEEKEMEEKCIPTVCNKSDIITLIFENMFSENFVGVLFFKIISVSFYRVKETLSDSNICKNGNLQMVNFLFMKFDLFALKARLL